MTTMYDSDIEDDDLEGADRGDNLPEDDGDDGEVGADKDDDKPAQPRGPDGKFAKSDEADEDDEDDEDADDDEDYARKGGEVANAAVRMDKLRAQRDAARQQAEDNARRLAALEARLNGDQAEEPADPLAELNTKLDSLYEQVEEARLDGDAKTAAKLQREIDATNRDIVKMEARGIAAEQTTQAAENARFDALLDVLEGEIDVLNPRADDFDPQAVKALEWHVAAFEKGGMPASKALRHAASVLFGFGSAPAQKEEKVVPLKRKTDVKKAVEHGKRQPPDVSTRGVDKDETKIRVADLSDEEFEKLPETKKAALRGDNF